LFVIPDGDGLPYIDALPAHAVRGYAAAPRRRGDQVTPTRRAGRAVRAHIRVSSPEKRRRRVNTVGYATRQHVDYDARVDGRHRSPADTPSGKWHYFSARLGASSKTGEIKSSKLEPAARTRALQFLPPEVARASANPFPPRADQI